MKELNVKIGKIIQWLQRHPYINISQLDAGVKLGRNEQCYCGSGLKYKKCCWSKHNVEISESVLATEIQQKEEKYFNKKYKELTNE